VFSILVDFGIFKSRSQARKNWNKSGKDIPEGLSHFTRIGKKKHEFAIFKQID